MFIQFLKQNKIYTVTFALFWVFNYLVSASFYKLMNINPELGDEFLTLPSKIIGALYSTIMSCGVVHFGVYLFYTYKEKKIS